MKEILITVIQLITGIMQMSMQTLLILIVFNKNINAKKLLLSSAISIFAVELPKFFIPANLLIVNLIIYAITITLALKYLHNLSLLLSVFSTGFIFILSTLVEYICMNLLTVFSKGTFDIHHWQNSVLLFLLMRLIAFFVCLLSAIIVYYFKFKIKLPEDVQRKRIFSIVINVIIVSIIIIPNMIFFQNSSPTTNIPFQLIVINTLSVFVLFILGIYNSIKTGELEIKKCEVEMQNLYIKTLNENIDALRSFKHDFNNIVQCIAGYIEMNDLNGLKKFCSQMQSEVRIINNTMPLNNYIKNDPALYSLILSKLSYAEVKDVKFNLSILDEINRGSIKEYDFCKVFGILLDNAIEAASESEKRLVDLYINKSSNSKKTVISISNTFSGNIDTEKIYENGFTTKNNHSGFGLFEVKKILGKYKNASISTSISGPIFTQKLEF